VSVTKTQVQPKTSLGKFIPQASESGGTRRWRLGGNLDHRPLADRDYLHFPNYLQAAYVIDGRMPS